jgi:hypothetical protein
MPWRVDRAGAVKSRRRGIRDRTCACILYPGGSTTDYRAGRRRVLAQEYRAVSRLVYSGDVHELVSRMVPSSQLSYMCDDIGELEELYNLLVIEANSEDKYYLPPVCRM